MKQKRWAIDSRVEIYNNDCIQFLKSLDNNTVDAIVTDPAYSGMNQRMKFGNGRIVGRYQSADNSKWFQEFHDDPNNYMLFLNECKRVLKDDRHIYIMFDSFSLLTLAPIIRKIFNLKNIITWDKVALGMGHYFRRRHEFIIFATKGYRKLSEKNIPDVWRFKRIHKKVYPTQKPVEIFEAMLKGSVTDNYVICDPFVGSGSSAIAALKKNCSFIGCDISKEACEIAAERANFFIKYKKDKYQNSSTVPETELTKFWI
jgi:site-specific DNA-methyltransferase (adenine-specific)